jgi:DNA-binding response OmpR family regulator
MALNPDSRARFNLDGASIMVVEPHPLSMDILIEILSRFGAKNIHRCQSVMEAQTTAEKMILDLIIIDAIAGEGPNFLKWLRRSELKPNATVPTILVSGHTPARFVADSRDCGAHFVMAKPFTPLAVLERILWVAREGRPSVMCDRYIGPDRRFHNAGVPADMTGRRRTDVPLEIGEATMPNLDQSGIDEFLRPQKVHL